MNSTKWTNAAKKQWVVAQLDASQRNVELAVMAIFNRQTADEQVTNGTRHNNSMGFNGLDAEFGSSLAKSIVNYGKLSTKQAQYARKIIGKYWSQLIEVAETKKATTGKGGAPWVVATIEAPVKTEREFGCPDCGCTEYHDGEICPVSGK